MPPGHAAGTMGRAGERLPVPIRTCFRSTAMTWETPTAVDYRFGFEITMYMYHD